MELDAAALAAARSVRKDESMVDPLPDARGIDRPSPWVARFAPLVPTGGVVLDVACGGGRHSLFFLRRGHDVVAVDRDLKRLGDMLDCQRLRAMEVDLEDGQPFPLRGQHFGAVVVTNYLYRPILGDLVSAVQPGGILIYETFAVGNQRFRGPSHPDYLLRPGELLEVVHGELRVVGFEDVVVDYPRPKVVQRIAAVREVTESSAADERTRAIADR